jgi:hypothetical protein
MPDPEVAAVVAKFEDELSKELDAPIGTTAVELDSRARARPPSATSSPMRCGGRRKPATGLLLVPIGGIQDGG